VLQVAENGSTYQLQLDPSQNLASTVLHLGAAADGSTLITATVNAPPRGGPRPPPHPIPMAVPSVQLLAQQIASSFPASGPVATGAQDAFGNHSADAAPALTQPQRAHVLM
jgi:hypothetical protein